MSLDDAAGRDVRIRAVRASARAGRGCWRPCARTSGGPTRAAATTSTACGFWKRQEFAWCRVQGSASGPGRSISGRRSSRRRRRSKSSWRSLKSFHENVYVHELASRRDHGDRSPSTANRFEVDDGRDDHRGGPRDTGSRSRISAGTRSCPFPGTAACALWRWRRLPKLVIACATQVVGRHGRAHARTRRVIARARGGDGVPPHQPSARLPDLRRGGGMQAPGLRLLSTASARAGSTEDKVHKPKRVELGPHVLLDTERCIMCSRCVRFCDEIAKKPQLTFTPARRPRGADDLPGRTARQSVLDEHHRHLPGRAL